MILVKFIRQAVQPKTSQTGMQRMRLMESLKPASHSNLLKHYALLFLGLSTVIFLFFIILSLLFGGWSSGIFFLYATISDGMIFFLDTGTDRLTQFMLVLTALSLICYGLIVRKKHAAVIFMIGATLYMLLSFIGLGSAY
jgi:hypothetical protein